MFCRGEIQVPIQGEWENITRTTQESENQILTNSWIAPNKAPHIPLEFSGHLECLHRILKYLISTIDDWDAETNLQILYNRIDKFYRDTKNYN